MGSNVILHVTLYSSHVGRVLVGSLQVVDDLVAAKEAQKVGVALECLNHREDVVHIVTSICARRVAAVDVLSIQGGVDIENDIYSNTVEYRHTLIVVEGLETSQ